jgi:hypothetical protein
MFDGIITYYAVRFGTKNNYNNLGKSGGSGDGIDPWLDRGSVHHGDILIDQEFYIFGQVREEDGQHIIDPWAEK